MEPYELTSEGEKRRHGPGAGAAGGAIVLLVLCSVVYVGTRSVSTTAMVFVGPLLAVVLFNHLYDRYVL